MNSKHRFLLINLLAFEFVLLNLVLALFLYFRVPEFSFSDPNFLNNWLWLAIIYNLSWLFIILYIRDNEFYFNPDYGYLKSLLISLFFFVGFVTTLVIVLKIRDFSRSTYILPIFIFSYLNLVGHKYLLKYLKKRSSALFSNTLLISSGYVPSRLIRFSKVMTQYGYNLVAYLEEENELSGMVTNLNIFSKFHDLPKILTANSIDEVFIDMAALESDRIKGAIKIADNFGVRVKLIPGNPILKADNYRADTMGGLAVFKLRQSPLDSFNKAILKRLFDFLFALSVIIVFFPIYLLIGILIYLDSKGPIFYTPLRKGESGKTFKCYKFRTMSVCDNPENGTKSTIVNDPRITRIGRILRKTDLDELPQFFNVLKGEMSVMGPRPHRINLQKDFRRSVNDYMVRSYIKPGITGWAQVNGWRGPTKTDEQKYERVRHDLWYIENWSFWLDIKIIFLTLFGKHRKNAF